MKVRTAVLAAMLAATTGVATPAAAGTGTATYDVIDLGTFGGTSSEALAINNSGAVAGYFTGSNNTRWAFRWAPGVPSETFGPEQQPWMGVDADGRVVGSANDVAGGSFWWTLSAGRQPVSPTLISGYATAADATAGIVGSGVFGAEGHAYLYDTSGIVHDLGTIGTGQRSVAQAVNARGMVAGWSDPAPGTYEHAFLYDGTSLIDIGTQGQCNSDPDRSTAYGIDDAGDVVGVTSSSAIVPGTTTCSPGIGFLYSQGALRTLPVIVVKNSVPGAWAYDINNAGQIVGMSADRAVLWNVADLSRVVDLTTRIPSNSGWALKRAFAVNDSGWIVGFGRYHMQVHAFLLKPR